MKNYSHIWKYSVLRFYILNFKWNLFFWLFAKKLYKNITYEITTDYYIDLTNRLVGNKKKVIKKRFVGYFYKNIIYQDNPGLQGIDDLTWEKWKSKKSKLLTDLNFVNIIFFLNPYIYILFIWIHFDIFF